ncbi:hypothetical protein [Actinocorallia lasiicapitis]
MTTAFDIALKAVEQARARHSSSVVDYRVADLPNPPEEGIGGFARATTEIEPSVIPGRSPGPSWTPVPGRLAGRGRVL